MTVMPVDEDKLARAEAHARKIFESAEFRYFTAKRNPDPDILRAAAHFLENEQPLPYWLGWETAVALRRHLRKLTGKKARLKEKRNYWRNLFIAKAVREIEQQFGFQPTRGPDKQYKDARPCGCSIVREVLAELGFEYKRGKKLKESGVIKAWLRISETDKQLSSVKLPSASNQKSAMGMSATTPLTLLHNARRDNSSVGH